VAKQDPTAGRSLWDASLAGFPTEKLTKDLRTDVLVVGAGITGSLVAEALSALGREVVVIDRHTPGEGSTSASTSLLLFEIDNPLILLADKIGKEKAARVWKRSFKALRNLTTKIKTLDIDCEYAERESLLLPGKVLGPAGLRRECEARVALGFPSRIAERDELISDFGIDRPNAILSGNSAESNPVKMALGILQTGRERGAKIFAPVEAKSIDANEKRVVVTTKGGHRITADFVVLCCGFDLPKFLSAKQHQIISTWAAATKPQPQNLWKSRALIWEAADPYIYIRTTIDGRVVVGGEDEDHNDNARRQKRIPSKIKRFRSKLKLLMPQIAFEDEDVDYAWSGAFGASETGLPVIGNVPGMPRVCAVLGFGGNGTTYAQVASEMIANALTGKPEPDIDLFAFGTSN
jgi:glycine/D-amino acid oxidase-like deaminating enzyme